MAQTKQDDVKAKVNEGRTIPLASRMTDGNTHKLDVWSIFTPANMRGCVEVPADSSQGLAQSRPGVHGELVAFAF